MPVIEIKIFKNYGGIGSRGEWSNTYHIDTVADITSATVAHYANILAAIEKSFHLNSVTFSRAAVREYYNGPRRHPAPRPVVIPVTGVGLLVDVPGADGQSKQLPAEVTLVVAHAAADGRPGRNLYRYAIATNEWTGGGGGVKLTQQKIDQVNMLWNNIRTNDDPAIMFCIPSRSKDGTPVHDVVNIQCTGAQNRQVRQYRKKKKTEAAVVLPPANTQPGLLARLSAATAILQGIADPASVMSDSPANATATLAALGQVVGAGLRLMRQLPETTSVAQNVINQLGAFI